MSKKREKNEIQQLRVRPQIDKNRNSNIEEKEYAWEMMWFLGLVSWFNSICGLFNAKTAVVEERKCYA